MTSVLDRANNQGHLIRVQSFLDGTHYGYGTLWSDGYISPVIEKLPYTDLVLKVQLNCDISWINNAWTGGYMALLYSLDGGTTWIEHGGTGGRSGFVLGMNYGGLGRQCRRTYGIDLHLTGLGASTSFRFKFRHRTYAGGMTVMLSHVILEEYIPTTKDSVIDFSTYPLGALLNIQEIVNVGEFGGGGTKYYYGINKVYDSDLLVEFYDPYSSHRSWSGNNGCTMVHYYSTDNGATWNQFPGTGYLDYNFRILNKSNVRRAYLLSGIDSNQISFASGYSQITAPSSRGSGDTTGMDSKVIVKDIRRWSANESNRYNQTPGRVLKVTNEFSSVSANLGTTEALVFTSQDISKRQNSDMFVDFYVPLRNSSAGAGWGAAILRFEVSYNSGSTWTQCGYTAGNTPCAMAGKGEICAFKNSRLFTGINSDKIRIRIYARAWDEGTLDLNTNNDSLGQPYQLHVRFTELTNDQ